VRIRTMFTFATGAALGAGTVYLLDPDHGAQRRREAWRGAVARARHGAATAVLDARRRAEEAALAAVDGYRQARDPAAGV